MADEEPEVAEVKRRLFALVALLSVASGRAVAQDVPPAGLAAEGAGRWEEAVAVYRRAVSSEPRRSELWARISTIEVRLNRPDAALRAMDAALSIQPTSPDYLRAGAVLATWQGEYAHAADRYRTLVALHQADDEVILGLARVTAWSGATDEAVGAYRQHLRAHPDATDAWLELARTESWRGNYAAAVDALASYRARAGETTTYTRELAQVLTHAGRPTPALALIDTLLQREPNALDLLATRPIAFALQGRAREAFDALDVVRRTYPEAREARTATDTVRVLLGSTVEPSASFYSDSDRLTIQRYAPSASLLFASGTRVSAGYDRALLHAPIRSGLGRADGGTAVFDQRWVGASQKVGAVTFEGRVGSARADQRSMTPYQVGVQVRASDTVSVTFDRASEFFVISPRTIELGMTDVRHRAALEWSPSLRTHLSVLTVVQQLSDGNERWEVTATPRTAIARTQRFNVDIGATAYLLGTTKDLPDGYYDPRRYENYGASLFPYLKLSENAGLGLSLAGGVQRDDVAAPFRFGGNVGAEATMGIYRPWVLALRASATNNRRAESGAFQGLSGSVALTRRF